MKPVMKTVTTRPGYVARVSVPRSPGCKAEGAFICPTRFRRRFVRMADIVWMSPPHGPNAEIREACVSKHHRLRAAPGQSVSIHLSEQVQQFARVSRSVEAPNDTTQVDPDSLQTQGVAA